MSEHSHGWVDPCPQALIALEYYSSIALWDLPYSVGMDMYVCVCVDLDLSIYTAHFELLKHRDHMGPWVYVLRALVSSWYINYCSLSLH